MPQKSKARAAREANIAKANLRVKKNTPQSYFRRRMSKKLFPKSHIDVSDIIDNQPLNAYYPVLQKDILRTIICGIIKKDLPLTPCSHFYIGSSAILPLMACKITPKETHSYIYSTTKRYFGNAAETAFARKHNVQKPPTFSSTKIPFICGRPDFTIGNRIVEIKSHKEKITLTKESLLQTLICMELCGFETGEIHLYETQQLAEDNYITQHVGTIGLLKRTTVFTDNFIFHSCKGYANYFGMLLTSQKITITPQETRDVFTFFVKHAHENNHQCTFVDTMRTSTVCELIKCCSFPSAARIKNIKGPRWSEADTRYSAYESKMSDFTDITDDKFFQDHEIEIRTNDVHSRYVEGSKFSHSIPVVWKNYYGVIRRDAKQKKNVTVEEISTKVPSKKALSIDAADIEKIFSMYYAIGDIGTEINDFDFL